LPIVLLLLSISLTAIFFSRNQGLRDSLVKSWLTLFALIAISTEVLSLLEAVTVRVIGAFWITATAVSLLPLRTSLQSKAPGTSFRRRLRTLVESGDHTGGLLLLVVCVLAMTLVVALVYPANNWDSMTYHMARVAQWIQHGTVAFYATSIDRQNYQPPLAEFAILHLQLLSASDRLANLVQWYSFLVAIVLATLLAKELQLSVRAQVLSAVIAATIPMAILQSSSTQNDVVTAAFCLAFAYFLLRLGRTASWPDAAFAALGFGLALLTKVTAYLYCCAIGLAIGGAALVSAGTARRRMMFGRLAAVVVAGLLLNVGHFSRNYVLYGHPLSTASGYTNDEVSIAMVLSNVIRNGVLHLDTPSVRLNRYGFRAIEKVLGDRLNDPGSTMATTRMSAPYFSRHEDRTGNPLHFLLTVVAFLTLPFIGAFRKSAAGPYAGAVVLAVVLYCVVLRWQPWATRLHTPMFMLAVPLIAGAVAQVRSFGKQLSIGLAALLFALSVPFLVSNKTRPLTGLTSVAAPGSDPMASGRVKSYFANRDLYGDYSTVARVILEERPDDVGLCFGYDDYEYPLWVLVGREASRGTPRFRHVGVDDVSKAKERPMPAPALVLATKRLDEDPIHGKGRRDATPCLQGEYATVLDTRNIHLWKLKDARMP